MADDPKVTQRIFGAIGSLEWADQTGLFGLDESETEEFVIC